MKKLFRYALVVLALAFTLVGGFPTSAYASSSSGYYAVAPGTRVCLAPSQFANYRVRAFGQATPGVRFTVASNNQILTQSADNARSFSFFATHYTSPGFAGYFQICARNLTTSYASVYMQLNTDADAQ